MYLKVLRKRKYFVLQSFEKPLQFQSNAPKYLKFFLSEINFNISKFFQNFKIYKGFAHIDTKNYQIIKMI